MSDDDADKPTSAEHRAQQTGYVALNAGSGIEGWAGLYLSQDWVLRLGHTNDDGGAAGWLRFMPAEADLSKEIFSVHLDRFLGNSFYADVGVGTGKILDWSDPGKNVTTFAVGIGNQWILGGNLLVGGEWLGVDVSSVADYYGRRLRFRLPSLTLGASF